MRRLKKELIACNFAIVTAMEKVHREHLKRMKKHQTDMRHLADSFEDDKQPINRIKYENDYQQQQSYFQHNYSPWNSHTSRPHTVHYLVTPFASSCHLPVLSQSANFYPNHQ